MAAFATVAACCRASRLIRYLAVLTSAGWLLAGCDREAGEHPRQIDGMKADVEEAKRRLSHLQNSLAAKDAELAVNTQALEAAKNGLTDLEKALNERNAQLRDARAELADLKKTDAQAFTEITATQQQGSSGLAVARYQKFVKDYPKSPLVYHANNAIAVLTVAQAEVRKQVTPADPAQRAKDFSKNFNEGYMTLQELAPYLKKRTLPQVLTLLGRPNQTFNEGTEIGYSEKAVNPVNGNRGMLIISFEGGTVSALRVEYAGRKMIP